MNQTNSALRLVFGGAVDITDAAARAAFLDSACKGDAVLRSRVEQLLAAESRAGGFFQKRDRGADSALSGEKIGSRIGRYRLTERIGEGGYGVVYLAEQEEPVRRQVALKVIKLGMDTSSVVVRFEAERQALAVMDHPNIARVFDAGATEAGRPFFVMELVRGIPITDYCEQKSLTVRQRLELIVQVCNGVQHAHQKGIIHRDLKPSNILVAEHDGVAVPKVIDFGIAKATDQSISGQANMTGAQDFIGTPAYMSPEQVQPGSRDIDTRTDIYSLGVILYELMTGYLPFDPKALANAGWDEMRRLIRETDPPRPSTRLTRELVSADVRRLTLTPELNRASSRRLLQEVRGDVDWIVMKCLEKDPARRYETANALATDIRRHLDNKTIAARPPTALYRFQKTFRRNRLGITSLAVIGLVLIAGVIVSSQLALRATRAEHEQSRLRGVAENKADESRQRLIRRYVAEGNRLLEEGQAVTALPWMVQALELEAGDRQQEADERLRIAQALVGAPELRLHLAQGKSVKSVALSPDGKLLATGSDDGQVRVSDVASCREIITNLALPGVVGRLRFSPDGARLVAMDMAGRARVWDAVSGEALTPLIQASDFDQKSIAKVQQQLDPAASFSPDGKLLLLAWGSKSAELRDPGNGKLVRKFTHDDVVYHAAFSPDGKFVVTSSKDSTARVWESATGKLAGPLLAHQGAVDWSQFSSAGSKLLTVRDRHNVQIWDWRKGQRLGREMPRRAYLTHASFSPDDSKVLTVARSGYAHLYDSATTVIVNDFLHGGGLVDAAFSPDNHHLAIACHDGNVWIWHVDDSKRQPMPLPEGNQIEQIAFSNDGRFLAVGTRGGHARVWELFPQERGVRRLPGSVVQWVEFDSSGRRALAVNAGQSRGVTVFDVQTGKTIGTIPLRASTGTRARFSPDGRQVLVFGHAANTAVVFEPDSGREIFSLKHGRKVQEAVWSPDGKRIFTAAGAAGLRVWDAETGDATISFPVSSPVTALSLSADGSRLASSHEDHTVQVWESLTGQPHGTSLAARGRIRHIEVSPDGKWLAISSEGIVEIHDVGSGELVGQPLGHRDTVRSLAFSHDGKTLATVCDDHTARVWNAATGEPITPWLRLNYEGYEAVFSPDASRVATLERRGALRLWSARTGEPLTAPIEYDRNDGDGGVGYSPDGLRLLISRGGDEARLRELQPETASLEELKLRAQVLSCTRFDPAAGMVPLDEASLNRAWKQLRALQGSSSASEPVSQ